MRGICASGAMSMIPACCKAATPLPVSTTARIAMSAELYLRNSPTGSLALNLSRAQAIKPSATTADTAPARITVLLP